MRWKYLGGWRNNAKPNSFPPFLEIRPSRGFGMDKPITSPLIVLMLCEHMPDPLLRKILPRRLMNLWPCYWGTGVRIKYVAKDFREIHLEVPLTWRTRNYVGTIFGGSMYGAVDPVCMLALIKNLGSSYEVWDKAATIRFKKPGRSTLHAAFRLEQEEINLIQKELTHTDSIDRVYNIDLTDDKGNTCATVEKIIHIRRKATDTTKNQAALDAGIMRSTEPV
jgi:acyl-coenzyme A thioesterase PaaI-like protein